MGNVVSLEGFTPGVRYDGNVWTKAQIGESASQAGPFATIATITLAPLDTDPTNPASRNFTITTAQLSAGWYLVTWLDAAANNAPSIPVQYPPPAMENVGYCSLQQVQARNAQRPVTPSSVPNVAQVSQFILDAAGELDAILTSKGYSVPVNVASSPVAAAVLQAMNTTGAWFMTEAAAPNSPNIDRAAQAWDAAKRLLMSSEAGLDIPVDVLRTEARAPWLTYTPDGVVFDPTLQRTGGAAGDGISTGMRGNPAKSFFSRQMSW